MEITGAVPWTANILLPKPSPLSLDPQLLHKTLAMWFMLSKRRWRHRVPKLQWTASLAESLKSRFSKRLFLKSNRKRPSPAIPVL